MFPRSGPSSKWLAAAFFITLALFASACGGDAESAGAGADIATLADDATDVDSDEGAAEGSSETEEDDTERTFEDAQLDFAVCMRASGIEEWPDPAAGSGGAGFRDLDFEALGIDPASDDFRTIIDECRAELDGVAGGREGLTPEEEAEQLDSQIALAACIRENPGWEDFPDPDPNGNGFDGIRELFQSGDLDPAEFRELAQTCAADLGLEQGPGGGGFGRPGGGADA